VRQLSELAGPITRGLVSLERALALIEQTADESGGSFSLPRATGSITMSNLTVQYPRATEPVLNIHDFRIQAGETVALVGASGAGKTTLVNLLPRFIEMAYGVIDLDGHDLREWSLDSLRSQFAVVSQNVIMLSGSIASNVAMGMLPIDRDKVYACLCAANLGSFIAGLPYGMDEPVGHNATLLSGGQRQRLAIARALYKDAPILILDEATSALDTESERAVQEALERLMKNRTTLVIAHRLSTVHHASKIMVMDSGRIVESGNHAQLMLHNAQYAHLYRMGLHESKKSA